MSFTITLVNLGFSDEFVHKWLAAFGAALPVSFPISLVITPLLKMLVDFISE